MENEFKIAAQNISCYYGPLEIGAQIRIALNRELTQDESFHLSRMCDDIVKYLHRNFLLNDPKRITQIATNKTNLLNCFPQPIYVKEIPNEYHSDDTEPWYLVTTHRGVIKLGWRKRVISIDWSDSEVEIDAEGLFPDQDVTKFDHTIHAYGYDKATEYIHQVLNS